MKRPAAFRRVKKEILKGIKMQSKEHDRIYLTCGEEGSGKSDFVNDCIELYAHLKGLKYDESYIGHINMSLAECLANLKNYASEDVWSVDECPELSNVEGFSTVVRRFTQTMTRIRAKRFMAFICYPNPFRMNAYISEDRVAGVFLVRRPFVWFFPHNVYSDIKKEMTGTSKDIHLLWKNKHLASFKDTYPQYRGILREAYLKKKEHKIDDHLAKMSEEFKEEEEIIPDMYDSRKVAAKLGIEPQYLSDILKRIGASIGFQKIGHRWFISREKYLALDMNKIMEEYGEYRAFMHKAHENSVPHPPKPAKTENE